MASVCGTSSPCQTVASRTFVPCAKPGVRGGLSLHRIPHVRSTPGHKSRNCCPRARSGKAGSDAGLDLSDKLEELTKDLADKWEATEQKPLVIIVALGGLVTLYVVNGIVSNVEKIPLFGSLFELVGLLVTGWFGYRYLVFESDRNELKENIDEFISKIFGK